MAVLERAQDYGQELRPMFRVMLEGRPLGDNVSQFIQRIEYESAEGIIDVAKFTVSNPNFVMSSRNVFVPGLEMDIFMGYGEANLERIGRVVLRRPKVTFPLDGTPMLEVIGYTKDFLMRERRPKSGKAVAQRKGEPKQKPVSWEGFSLKEMIDVKASDWNMEPDVDNIPWGASTNAIQPISLSDYEYLQSLANITGSYFWIDYDAKISKWKLHFKAGGDRDVAVQDKTFEFIYNFGDFSTLLNFEPQFMYDDHYTQIRVQAPMKHPYLGVIGYEDILLVEDEETEPAPVFSREPEELKKDWKDAESIRLFVGDYSFHVATPVWIWKASALEDWARQWWRKMRTHFITGNGSVIGHPALKARQVHKLTGLGKPWDGEYYFSRVRHIMAEGEGYRCEFSARKKLPKGK